MDIKEAEFKVSNTTFEKCPPPFIPEYAFIGRSNVGKSSLINMLVGKKGLAKTSATPGKTQLINHFIINKKWYLVDLPGYGYAQASKTSKAAWDKMIKNYLQKRENLLTVFILIDIRLDPQPIDINFIQWVGEKEIPLCIVFTKADKLSRQQVIFSVEQFKRELRKSWAELPVMFVSSAEKKTGRDEILEYIGKTNDEFKDMR
jgi:GTP-binding protein